MALTFTEMTAATDDFFMMDGGEAYNNFFNESFALEYFLNQKKGTWKRYSGGSRIKVPILYDRQAGGAFDRTDTLSSSDQANTNAAYFLPKYYYGNATIHMLDEVENAGTQQEVDLMISKIYGAQEGLSKDLAEAFYADNADSAKGITGLQALTDTSTSRAYGGITPTDLQATDGSYPWTGLRTTSAAAMTLAAVRTLCSGAKVANGPGGKPNLVVMPEAGFNIVRATLQSQQQYKESDGVRAGFQTVVFEGATIAADDYCPAAWQFALNDKYCGFAVHQNLYFKRTPWADTTMVGTPTKTMKIWFGGNFIVTRRKAHKGQSGMT